MQVLNLVDMEKPIAKKIIEESVETQPMSFRRRGLVSGRSEKLTDDKTMNSY